MEKERRSANKVFYSILICLPMVLFVSSALAAEEPYPNRPINMMIHMAPGGVVDTHVKIVGDRMAEILGQPLVRVHKPGGGGSLAASLAAKAKPDGYTLFTGTSTTNVLIPMVKKVDYTVDDLLPIGIYCKGVHGFYVKTDAKWKTFQEFIDDARTRPDPMKISSYGKQTFGEFVIEDLNKKAGIKLVQVPYKSCAETVSAVMGGHVDADVCTSSMGQVAAGAVRLLAVADYERSEFSPDVKTMKEWGYPVTIPAFFSFCVPAKTPKPIVDKLSNAVQEVFKRHGKQIKEELLKLETVAAFYDMPQSIQRFKENYEMAYRIAKEIGYIESK
jgi:tripartite-type tricarboxylate transporter receptor subunit TctC